MNSQNRFVKYCALAVCLVYAGLVGCSSADNDLARFIDDTKKEPGGRVEPLPEVKPYETFIYSAAALRSPFQPGGSGGASASGVRPDQKRNREFLEQFSLDTLKMVGTLKLCRACTDAADTGCCSVASPLAPFPFFCAATAQETPPLQTGQGGINDPRPSAFPASINGCSRCLSHRS